MKNHQKSWWCRENNILKKLGAKNFFLAGLSGFLLFLSFPKFGSGWFAWVALIPLFFALKNAATVAQGMLLGFVSGVVAYVGIIYWIAYVIVNYGYLPLYVGVFLMLLLASYLSLYVSLFSACLVHWKEKMPFYMMAPGLWVCFEYGKSYILTGFPWQNLGYSQYLNIYFIQIADIVGVFGISFLVALVNAVLFDVINKKSKREYIAATVVFFVLTGVYIYGFYRLEQIDRAVEKSQPIEVSLIQGNIDQSIKWDKYYQTETLNIYEQLSLKNFPAPDSLIIWPETALPFRFQDTNALHDQVIALSHKTKSWLLFGSISSTVQKGPDDYFNSAYLLSPSGDVTGKYDKVHLVPYGEYVPLRNVLPFVRGFTAGIGDFKAGNGYYPLFMKDKKVGVLICYEGILPHAARRYKKHAAELLVNITNDAWFGATSAPYQHFSMAVLRAVETRLYLVRAANTGISGMIDPAGRIIAKTKIFQQDALRGCARFVNIPTVYGKYGEGIVVLLLILNVLCFVIHLKRRT